MSASPDLTADRLAILGELEKLVTANPHRWSALAVLAVAAQASESVARLPEQWRRKSLYESLNLYQQVVVDSVLEPDPAYVVSALPRWARSWVADGTREEPGGSAP